MTHTGVRFALCVFLICCALPVMAQHSASADSVVPAMVKFTGTLNDVNGKPLTGSVGVTFLLYKEETGGAPLWIETQNVQADKNGHYSVMLGSATSHGLPAEAFTGGEARWLGVQASGQAEQSRVVLVSVPYALKALDAETLGGKPASAFLQAMQGGSGPEQAGPLVTKLPPVVHGIGTVGAVPLWTAKNIIDKSIITQSATSISVAGDESVSGNISTGGNLLASGSVSASGSVGASGNLNAGGNVNANGNVSASTVKATAAGQAMIGTMTGNNAQNAAIVGFASATGTGNTFGVEGFSFTTNGAGVVGINQTSGYGVYGYISGSSGQGVWGESHGTSVSNGAGPDGVHGVTHSNVGSGVAGINDAAGGAGVTGLGVEYGVVGTGFVGTYGISDAPGGISVYGDVTNGGLSGFFNGNVEVLGNLSKGGGSFKIDHPLDPANKYLYHSFVESPDMMNIYNGNVTTDAQGNAIVRLPDWFEVLNRDFRYQLTVIGQFAQAIVASEIADRQFSIKTDKPGVKVSWQVTGIRQDAWANAHRIPVEVLKPEQERGFYLHPELFGVPAEKSIASHRHPDVQKLAKETGHQQRSVNR